jgi:hypothetical protein
MLMRIFGRQAGAQAVRHVKVVKYGMDVSGWGMVTTTSLYCRHAQMAQVLQMMGCGCLWYAGRFETNSSTSGRRTN